MVGASGARLLVDALVSNTRSSVTALALAGNALRLEGAKHICRGLQDPSCNWRLLDLRDNEMGTDGSAVLADGLTANSSLTEIDVRGNEMGGDGMGHIARALITNKSLCTLNSVSFR